jgi:hypothetical protein
MSPLLVVALLVLVVLAYLWGAGKLGVVTNALPSSSSVAPATSSNASSPSPSSSAKYASLIAVLQKTPQWVYFDEKLKSRQTIDFKLNPNSQDLVMKASVAKEPGNFKYSKAGGRDDTMQLLDPGKGDASKYATYIMYVDDKNIIIEEKTDGKITFQQKLNA